MSIARFLCMGRSPCPTVSISHPETTMSHRTDLTTPTDTDIRLLYADFLDLVVRLQEPVILGIGPGGHLSQRIYADNSNPRMWDIASSRILYIHIVHSYDFTAVTGLAPPETPVTWKTYKDLRLPFNRGWERGDNDAGCIGSDGAFDNLTCLGEISEEASEETKIGDRYSTKRVERRGSGYWVVPGEKVPSLPLALLEADQTKPVFSAE